MYLDIKKIRKLLADDKRKCDRLNLAAKISHSSSLSSEWSWPLDAENIGGGGAQFKSTKTLTKGKKLKGKTMVIGATGAVGSVCARLLATAFEEVYMVDSHDAKLLSLRESMLDEIKDVNVHITTRSDRFIDDMDVIVTASSPGPGEKILDIEKVKPGCVITDVNRPLNLTIKDAKNDRMS